MTERPILFSAPMVRALLDGRKTQTRRILKPRPESGYDVWQDEDSGEWFKSTRFGDWALPGVRFAKGMHLWVRERCITITGGKYRGVRYIADGADCGSFDSASEGGQWDAKPRPSIHMPRWASRLTLTVTDVRVQRLQDISDEDCLAEGIDMVPDNYGNGPAYRDYGLSEKVDTAEWYARPIDSYRSLWVKINGAASWVDRPWIVAVSFDVHRCNIDQGTQP